MENDRFMKALDLCIYDYLTRKELHSVARSFAQEANVSPIEVAMTPPDGLLKDWWYILWATYTGQQQNVAPETAGSSITAGVTPDLISRLSIEQNNATSVTNTADQNLLMMLSMKYDALLARMLPSSSSPGSFEDFINDTARLALIPPFSSSSGNLQNYSDTQRPHTVTRSDESQGSTTADLSSELTSQLQNLARQESETQQSEAAPSVSRKGKKSTKSNRNEKSR